MPQPSRALAEESGLTLDRTALSQITRMELLSDPRLTEPEEQEIRAFMACCQVLLLSETIQAQAITLRRAGAFKLPDAVAAATAITGQLRLLTLDQRMLSSLQRLGSAA